MINCYAEVRNVQVKPNDTVEIKLVVDVDELSG